MASSVDDFSDLQELGININEKLDPLTRKFNLAAKQMQTLASHLDNDTLLKMYAHYKQSLEGPCTAPKPSWYDMRGKAKWEAWMALGNLSQNVAKEKYIQGVLEIDPDFEGFLRNASEEESESSESWVRVSSFLVEKDEKNNSPVTETDNLIEYIQENNISKVKEVLSKLSISELNTLDSNGMGVIHWAADRGSRDVLELILEQGADINLRDKEGQTALHFAASCGNQDCVEFILNKGGRTDLEDNEGLLPLDVAGDECIQGLLKNR